MKSSNEGSSRVPRDQGERDCEREEMAYRAWLRLLTPLRWTCVSGGVVFSTAAGVSVLWDGLPHGKVISAILAFSAAILTGLHTRLNCDAHQSECRRLIQAFKSLRDQYKDLGDLRPLEEAEQRKALNKQRAKLKETATAIPATWCYSRADNVMNESQRHRG